MKQFKVQPQIPKHLTWAQSAKVDLPKIHTIYHITPTYYSSRKTSYLCQVLHLEEHPALFSLRRWRIPPDTQWALGNCKELCWDKAVGFNCCVYSCPKSPRAVAVQCIRDACRDHAHCHRQQWMPSFNLIWMSACFLLTSLVVLKQHTIPCGILKDIRKKKKNRDLSGREGKAGLLTLAKCLLLEVLPLTMYIHSCCFFPVKKEKEPAKQIFSSKLQPKLWIMQEMEKVSPESLPAISERFLHSLGTL